MEERKSGSGKGTGERPVGVGETLCLRTLGGAAAHFWRLRVVKDLSYIIRVWEPGGILEVS